MCSFVNSQGSVRYELLQFHHMSLLPLAVNHKIFNVIMSREDVLAQDNLEKKVYFAQCYGHSVT